MFRLPPIQILLPQERGIRLFTSHVRRGAPDVQDPAWNSHSKLNCISACIQVGPQHTMWHVCSRLAKLVLPLPQQSNAALECR